MENTELNVMGHCNTRVKVDSGKSGRMGKGTQV